MKILFQGDSITHAFRKEEELNPAFQLGNGYVFLAASRLDARFPDRGLQFFNRGVCGDGVNRLRARWQGDALDLAPDCLSLLLGVNDTVNAMNGTENLSDEEFAHIYSTLISEFVGKYPEAKVILLEPFLLETGAVTAEWKDHLRPRQAFVREFAAREGYNFIPLQGIFDAARDRAPAAFWAWDGIHPTHAGFQLIADAWLAATNGWFDRRERRQVDEPAPEAPAPEPASLLRIREWLADLATPLTWVFTGDSITHGAFHTYGQRDYTELVSERLRWELGRSRDCIIKTGVSGWKIGNLLQEMDRNVLRHAPQIVSINLGMNDCNGGAGDVANFKASYRTALDRIVSQTDAALILHAPNPIITAKDDPLWKDLPFFAEAVRELASEYGTVLVDHEADWKTNTRPHTFWLTDEIHPNDFGHRRMAHLLLRELGLFDPSSLTCRLFVP